MNNQTFNSQIEEIIEDSLLREELKKLVLERMNVMPDSVQMTVGSQALNKQELVGHIQKEDEIGRQIMAMELDFLQDLASGAIYGEN